MLHPSTQQLIRKLCELTDAGAIDWKEGEGQCSVFETEGYIVEIRSDPSVRLLRADGHELESADAADLAALWAEGEGTYATHVADMARHASRIARGAETAIAKILSSLSAPPKKQPESEPEPAAPAFADAEQKLAHSVPASESAAAIAAVNADLESQRRQVTESPPISHAMPEAPVAIVAPETKTAIDRVLAIQPVVRAEPLKEPPAPTPAPAEIEPEPVVEAKEEAPLPPNPIDLPPPFADSTMQPQLAPQTIAPVVIAPAPEPIEITPPVKPAAAPLAARAGFGAIDTFSRPTRQDFTPPKPKPEPAKAAPFNLLASGISARSRQTVEPSTVQDSYRPLSGQPAPTPSQLSAPEKKHEPAVATGADIYKPWG